MKKIIVIVSIIIVVIVTIGVFVSKPKTTTAAGVTGPAFLVASSTAFTLTTSSLQLLATTTSQGQSGARVSATIQPINCTAGASGAFLALSGGAAATANTGLIAFASSTLIFGDHVNQIPNVHGAVTGITAVGTCTVLVTEWRTK